MSNEDRLDAWQVSAADAPLEGSDAEKLEFCVRVAVLAPSGHNTQPWLFRVVGEELELHADRSRALPVVDPHDRELTIACGAALFYLRIAARTLGHEAEVSLLPDPEQPDLLARVRLGPGAPPSDEEAALFRAIPERRTTRLAFEDREPPGDLVAALQAAAEAAGTWLHITSDEERAEIVEMIAEGDRRQMADKRFRRELASWMHPNRSRSGDGMRGYSFGLGELVSEATPHVIRRFDVGKRQAATDRDLVENSPLLVVLGTGEDGPAVWLAAGQALARLLLLAQDGGVTASFMNQPNEVEELRPRITEAISRVGSSQLLVRMGYGPEVEHSARRPLADVLTRE